MTTTDPRHYDVIVSPVITEKATNASEQHTSSVTKEGGWNRKIRRAIEPAMHAPINARHVRAHGSRTFSGGAPIARRVGTNKSLPVRSRLSDRFTGATR